jgi:hypothetical protein
MAKRGAYRTTRLAIDDQINVEFIITIICAFLCLFVLFCACLCLSVLVCALLCQLCAHFVSRLENPYLCHFCAFLCAFVPIHVEPIYIHKTVLILCLFVQFLCLFCAHLLTTQKAVPDLSLFCAYFVLGTELAQTGMTKVCAYFVLSLCVFCASLC